jgi:hypothetical protein
MIDLLFMQLTDFHSLAMSLRGSMANLVNHRMVIIAFQTIMEMAIMMMMMIMMMTPIIQMVHPHPIAAQALPQAMEEYQLILRITTLQ